ncbi:MAG: hypothetical protein ACPGXL_06200, partial [Chitinophagales bacterium]
VVIGYSIPRQLALNMYFFINFLGIALGFAVAYMYGNYKLGWIHVITAALLWFYSTTFKKKVLIGNIVVACLTALVVLLVAIYEQEVVSALVFKWKLMISNIFESITGYEVDRSSQPSDEGMEFSNFIFTYISAYAFFAFMLTIIRELVKDAEDVLGDRAANYQTLPLVWGIQTAKFLAAVSTVIVINFVALFQLRQYMQGDIFITSAALAVIQAPLLFIVFRLWQANTSKDFRQLSNTIKVVMLMGLLFLPYFRSTIQLGDPVVEVDQPLEGVDFDMQVDTIISKEPMDTLSQ